MACMLYMAEHRRCNEVGLAGQTVHDDVIQNQQELKDSRGLADSRCSSGPLTSAVAASPNSCIYMRTCLQN